MLWIIQIPLLIGTNCTAVEDLTLRSKNQEGIALIAYSYKKAFTVADERPCLHSVKVKRTLGCKQYFVVFDHWSNFPEMGPPPKYNDIPPPAYDECMFNFHTKSDSNDNCPTAFLVDTDSSSNLEEDKKNI